MDLNPTGIFLASILSAVVFALIALKARQSYLAWAQWGALGGLVVFTITVGMAHAMAVPYTAAEQSHLFLWAYVWAALILALVAAILIWRIRQQREIVAVQVPRQPQGTGLSSK